ncbi:MAG TPA: aconitate hydratase AcnA [Acidimicrobiales bacterium]|jgi:aconitate hydratase|nr:aconitate hydratase AcnA [Acidimicrobiales bacterium]
MSTDSTNTEHPDTFDARADLTVGDRTYEIFNITAPALSNRYDIARLPYSIKVLLENLLRHEDGPHVSADDIVAVANWGANPEGHGQGAGDSAHEIAFTPERVLMQDFTGVPAVVDLAAMRDALAGLGGNASQVNPLVPVELVIDHSVIIEESGDAAAYDTNVSIEYGRNMERYQLIRWAQGAFQDFRAVPPGMGICHQVNLEYLSRLVFATEDGRAFCDSLVGTDSHTVMVNGLGVLGWGVGGIEAEAAMLGQPLSMLLPPVVGLRISGEPKPGITATDVVLTVTELLRDHGVVGAFVECYGPGVAALPLETRATIGNMSPEYGATCTMFPIDQVTIDYLRFTGRDDDHLELVEAFAKAQGLWHDPDAPEPVYSEHVSLDLGDVEPSLAGPARPQDRVSLSAAGDAYRAALDRSPRTAATEPAAAPHHQMTDGDVVIAAITSCTNTSNPQVMVAAGLVAKKAVERGLRAKPWVKTSLAPGSRVVTDYLDRAGLTEPLQQLGFYLVGYGCTTCIGNSGPLLDGVTEAVKEGDLSVVSVLSGNRNFEGRIHPDVRLNYLASPPLVVAYALAGTIDTDLTTTPIGEDAEGKPVLLSELWPTMEEVSETIRASLTSDMFRTRYSAVFDGDEYWQQVSTADGETYSWQDDSTYVQNPPYFEGMTMTPAPVSDIAGARVLALLGDSVTTDHISPAGSIGPTTPAGRFLTEHGVARHDFNSYGARRGNHEVMMRGTFANVRLRNLLAPGTEGGITLHLPDGAETSIFEAAMQYADEGVPLVVLAGREYGTGSSRDWAAKGTALLGVRAVIAQSFERIHRSNLIGMGVVPLQFYKGDSAQSLGLTGHERFAIAGLEVVNKGELPKELTVTATADDDSVTEFRAIVRIDTPMEAEYYRHGGILQYVLRQMAG